jgi:hypothetical protein
MTAQQKQPDMATASLIHHYTHILTSIVAARASLTTTTVAVETALHNNIVGISALIDRLVAQESPRAN